MAHDLELVLVGLRALPDMRKWDLNASMVLSPFSAGSEQEGRQDVACLHPYFAVYVARAPPRPPIAPLLRVSRSFLVGRRFYWRGYWHVPRYKVSA